jgi:hypothetical protein
MERCVRVFDELHSLESYVPYTTKSLLIQQVDDAIVVGVIPPFEPNGTLPVGIHWASWEEFVDRVGATEQRRMLLAGLAVAIEALRLAGCRVLFVNGSFVTSKAAPEDYEAVWETDEVVAAHLDPVFLDFSDERAAQKAKYLGEFFPITGVERASGLRFVDFFQRDRDDRPKGIIGLDLHPEEGA